MPLPQASCCHKYIILYIQILANKSPKQYLVVYARTAEIFHGRPHNF